MHGLNSAVVQAMRRAAAQAIMPRFARDAAVPATLKSPGEPVTVADRECEAILTEALGGLIPGSRIIGEEAAHESPHLLEDLGTGTCWLIDPLDGTGNFAKGQGPFGILVALVDQGIPVGGWILDPLADRAIWARAGAGAWIDGQALRAPAQVNSRPHVAVTRLFADPAGRDRLVRTLAEDCLVSDSPRCAADQYPRVALGTCDATLFTRTLAWDHAAGVIILNEAGGCARRPDGRTYRCDDDQGGLLVAVNAATWHAIADRVAQSGVALRDAALAQVD